jgi:arsenite methyltransferase
LQQKVRERYGAFARENASCCGPHTGCGGEVDPAEKTGKSIGYSNKDLESVPQGANLGLGCGNTVAIAKLQDGETVLDLGSGAGFDCFLASKKSRTGRKDNRGRYDTGYG